MPPRGFKKQGRGALHVSGRLPRPVITSIITTLTRLKSFCVCQVARVNGCYLQLTCENIPEKQTVTMPVKPVYLVKILVLVFT